MRAYLIRRLRQSIYVVVGLSLLVFGLLHLTGDPASVLLPPYASADEVASFREKMGFNAPIWIQYLRFARKALGGDFGTSFLQGQPALDLILQRVPATLELSAAAMAFALALALPAGIISALKRDGLTDYLCMTAALLGQSIAVFWLGLMLMTLFSVQMDLFPVSGRGSLAHLVLPAITLGSYTAARTARLTRAELLEVLGQDFIRTARSKGMWERVVVMKHAFRNVMVPIVTIVALELGTVLGGAVITETIFAWPGVARLMVQSIYERDFPVVQAGVFLIGVTLVALNLLVDVLYAYLDPRVRYS
jgi:peptide/nickel transport system permease protein